MTSTALQPSASAARPQSIVLLPGEKFFVRRIPLTPGQDAAGQVELALETFGPFSPGQIFHGFCRSRDGKQALLFAAYRKNFSPEEIASWATADLVLPEFALWLAPAAIPAAGTWLYENREVLHLIAWDGYELPAGLLFRRTDQAASDFHAGELLDEAAKRLGVPVSAPRRLGGDLVVERWSKEGLSLKLDKPGQTMAAVLPVTMARSMDVRDKTELASLAQLQKRTHWLWLTFAGLAAGVALCALGELGLQVGAKLLDRTKQGIAASSAAAQQIEQADALAGRMEKLAGQRFKLVGMLAALNDPRPRTNSLNLIRMTINSPTQMEIEAQTSNAGDLRDYEQALRRSPAFEKVEVRDPRTREGVTTFQLVVVFKPGFPVEEELK